MANKHPAVVRKPTVQMSFEDEEDETPVVKRPLVSAVSKPMISETQLQKLKEKQANQDLAKQRILSGTGNQDNKPIITRPKIDVETELLKLKVRERSRSRSLSPTSRALKRAQEREKDKKRNTFSIKTHHRDVVNRGESESSNTEKLDDKEI